MADFAASKRLAELYFRRKCSVDGVLSAQLLTSYADQVAACAQEEVLIIGNTFEGGSAQGQAKFDKIAAATALEELLLEADPTLARAVTQTQATFRCPTATSTDLCA